MNQNQIKGLVLSLICLLSYAAANIFFKVTADAELNSLLIVSMGMVFTGFALIFRGGRTNFAYDNIKSAHTWYYGLSYIAESALIIYMMSYISATEAAVATRISILGALLAALVFQRRNTLKQGIWGVPFILLGTGLIIFNFQGEVLAKMAFCLIAITVVRNIYYFSIELNKTAKLAEKSNKDLSAIGYIMGVTSLLFISILFTLSLIDYFAGYHLPFIPKLSEFMSLKNLGFAAFYGLTISILIRYTEYKSVQYVKSEVFQCITAFSPLVTLALETSMSSLGLIDSATEFGGLVLLANILVVTGALIVIIRKYATIEESNPEILAKTRKKVESALSFYNDDYSMTARKLAIPAKIINDILDDVEHKKPILRRHVSTIAENYAETVLSTDKITLLPKRETFEAEIKDMEAARDYTLIFYDLNKFKPVNDTYGHEAGDEILKRTGQRIREFLADDATVCRLGGDEFVIAIPDAHKSELVNLAKEIAGLISTPHQLEGIEDAICVGSAHGMASYPEDGDCYDEILKQADAAMYANKTDDR